MKTKEENMGKEEEHPTKKELLSDEELLKVVAGYLDQECFQKCRDKGVALLKCSRRCGL